MRDLPPWAKDVIHTDVDIHFDFVDRLRILFGAKVHLRVRTDCEHAPGRVESESIVSVARLRRQKLQLGTVEAAPVSPEENTAI